MKTSKMSDARSSMRSGYFDSNRRYGFRELREDPEKRELLTLSGKR
jgi:hypothetical protein